MPQPQGHRRHVGKYKNKIRKKEEADIFPLMNKISFEELKKDISKNGLLEPIWTYQDQIIDGRNRYNACKKLKIEPVFNEWDGKGSLIELVISLNLHRRHLNSAQKAAIAVEILPIFEKALLGLLWIKV